MHKVRVILIPLFALSIGISGGLAIAAALGENPLHVFMVIAMGSFGSLTDFGYALYYATPLLLTGLSVAWAFQAGLFNIGAEGQMALGGITMAAVGISLARFTWLPSLIAIALALLAAFIVGGLWGAMAGWIKAKRGCHEVLTTILLNFIAYGISSFLILSVFKNPDSQVPETALVGGNFEIPPLPWLGGSSPLSAALYLSLLAVLVYFFVFRLTRFGFHQRLTGGAPEVGRRAGIKIDRQIILAMFFSGGLAALAAAGPVLGFAHKTREGFTSSIGFIGIAVALLGRNTAIGVVLSALLFGMLTKGALDLDLDTKYVSRDLAIVIQAFIVIAVASQIGLESIAQTVLARLPWRKIPAQNGEGAK